VAQTSYTHAELVDLWLVSGGSAASADTAAAIAQAESGGCIYAHAGPTDDRPQKVCTFRLTNGEDSYGLWQINRRAHPQYTVASLYAALGNAHAAVAIASGGSSFGAWSTYTSGAYKQYLSGVPITPTTGSTGGGGGTSSGGATPIQGGPSSSLTGWNALTQQWATHLPTALAESKRLRSSALRMVGGKRKVAG
jgi:hypothetical protein